MPHTSDAELDNLDQAGINTRNFREAWEHTLAEANKCDVHGVILQFLGIAYVLDDIHTQIKIKAGRDRSHLQPIREMAWALEDAAVKEIMETLKAKQCKCG